MRIGYQIDTHKGVYGQPAPSPEDMRATMDAMLEEGIVAERAGFHSLQIPHRHARTELYFPGPEQMLTIFARETERVAIGTFTFINTLTHPLKAAEQFAVVDNLSGGRLYTTLSRGFHPAYWQQFGVPQEKLLGRFKEGLEIWRLAFAGESFSFHGKHWQVDEGLLVPQPFQRGGWPIWGGGHASQAAIERCADYADCWTCDPYPLSPEAWEASQAGAYRRKAEERGKEPFVVLMRDGWVADTFEEAAEAFGRHYVAELRFYFEKGIFTHHPDFQRLEDITPENVRQHAIIGTRDDCIEQIEKYKDEFGADYISLRQRMATGPSLEATREQIQRFGEEVVSYFHARDPAPDHPAIPAACRW